MRLLSSFIVAFLSVAPKFCGCALGEEWTDSDDLFDLEQEDLFSNALDLSSIDIATSEDPVTWASSLQPIDAYMSEKGVFSFSPTSDFLSSADQSSSACLTEEDDDSSSGLFGRSDDSAVENYIAAGSSSSSDFCFQNPDKPSTEIPPITNPNLFDLLQQPGLDDLISPFDTFPRRPVCEGPNPAHVLCCDRDREKDTGFAVNCERCMYSLHIYLVPIF